MGSTDCQYFSTTTVPATDTTAPTAWDAVWTNGDYAKVINSPGSFTYHIPLGGHVIAIASAIDGGGVRKVTMQTDEIWTCCSGNICSSSEAFEVPTVATQSGSVGATVSTGVWTGLDVTTGSAPCGALTSYQFSWTTTAEDFHGNKVVGAMQRIVYP
jgi:hypothetical protein